MLFHHVPSLCIKYLEQKPFQILQLTKRTLEAHPVVVLHKIQML